MLVVCKSSMISIIDPETFYKEGWSWPTFRRPIVWLPITVICLFALSQPAIMVVNVLKLSLEIEKNVLQTTLFSSLISAAERIVS